MTMNPFNNSDLEQLALKGLVNELITSDFLLHTRLYNDLISLRPAHSTHSSSVVALARPP